MGSRGAIVHPTILAVLLCQHAGESGCESCSGFKGHGETACLTTMILPHPVPFPLSFHRPLLPRNANRPIFRLEHHSPQAIIYVIDSSDASRLATSRSELLTMLSEDELKSVPVLVFANKQDVPGALSPADISDKLGLAGGEKGREWSVRGSCATKGDGLEEGLDW